MFSKKLEPCLNGAALHPSHFLLHFVKVEVQGAVFLPDSETSDYSDIDHTLSRFLLHLTDLDNFARLPQSLTAQSAFWQQILDTDRDT